MFFITSSDSGSLVIDTIAAGGKIHAPVPQRIFWCSFEGLVAIALLLGGGLAALQAMFGDRLYVELQRHNLPATRLPDAGFSLSMHQWTAGAPLGYALAAAAESGAELTPGDFVRWCRQVIDLLEQVKKTGYSEQIRDNANRAVDAIRRGVVAIGN